MVKFLPQKKKLIEDVFEKACGETTEQSFSGILKSLENTLKDDYNIVLSYNTFKTYYQTIVVQEQDYNIKPMILDDLSTYLGYDNFKSYCAEWKTVEYNVRESMSKVVINVINKPLLRIPELITKQSGLGLLGILMIGGVFLGKNFYQDDEKERYKEISQRPVHFVDPAVAQSDAQSAPAVQNDVPERKAITILERSVEKPLVGLEHYMYWNGERFVATAEADLGAEFRVLPRDDRRIRFFRKILQPDTITKNSIKKVWYSKKNNVVEFFTADGRNPDNDAELHQLSEHIFNKYISQQD